MKSTTQKLNSPPFIVSKITGRPPKKTLAKNWKNRCHQRHQAPSSAITHVAV